LSDSTSLSFFTYCPRATDTFPLVLRKQFHSSWFIKMPLFFAGLYMPCICLLAGSLLIKAFAMWLKLNEKIQAENPPGSNQQQVLPVFVQNIGVVLISIHLFGLLLASSTETVSYLGLELRLMTVDSISLNFFASFALSILIPFFLRW
jgi:Gaa1-like, GPI transamidase component